MNYKRFALSGLLLSAILILFACNDDIDLSPDLQGNTQFLETQFTDTLTIETTVGIWDTINTTFSPYMLVGNSSDKYFGTLTANAFAQFILPRDSLQFEDTQGEVGTLDSMVFSLDIHESFGDTLSPQTLEIHILSQRFNTSKTYYQTDEIPYDQKIATLQIDENTDLSQPLHIHLEPDWAKRIYEAGGTDDFLNQNFFEEWFTGIRISAIDGNMVHKINPLSANTFLGVYYHTKTDTLLQRIGTYDGQNIGYRFNQILTDLSSSDYLSELTPQTEISTKELNHWGFIQEGTGIYTKVRIPNLEQLNANGDIYLNRAELTFEPSEENYLSPNRHKPIGLTFRLLDKNGNLVQNAATAQDQYILREVRDGAVHVTSFVDGRLVSSYIPNGRTYQAVRMTSYIQEILNGTRGNYGFAIESYRNDVGINNLLFSDNSAETNPLKLKIYYTKTK